MTIITKIQIIFWKIIGIIWDSETKKHLPKYCDYPIACCDIADNYDYFEDFKILFEYNEKGKHWIVFSR